jgi:glycosyltransferase involved in cell wall biosynthesis
MRVDLIHYSALPVVGGVESVMDTQARLMADDGQQVRVVAGRGTQVDVRIPFVQVPLADSRHPQVLAVKAELDRGILPPEFAQLRTELYERLVQVFADTQVIIAHNVCSLHKNLPLTAALQQLSQAPGAPRLILWHHDLAWTTPRYQAELFPGYPWDLLRTVWPDVKQVVVSQQRQEELAALQKIPAGSIAVIPNGLDARQFLKLDPLTMTLVERLGLYSAHPLLLLPVRITPRKNLELALRVLSVLRETFPAAALVITGPLGPHNPKNQSYLDRLLSLRQELGLEQAAIFLAQQVPEYLPYTVVADFYRLADALLFPSFEEGFGIPILEAGLSRLPVFCSDIPPLRELAGDQAVYFSPQAEPGKVAALINEKLSSDRVFALQARVQTNYTWERIYAERIKPVLVGESERK